ncbi:hypothetical protein FACS1894141_1720 [Spirochaetia bacterium]|nr:hypothetical protein FACS1894141_1720 [Spirochaetia bacterium]
MKDNCDYIHNLFNEQKKYTFPFCSDDIPKNGIYILFENGETAHSTNRIVRIGTHTGENQLPSRLKQHFLTENKDRSIFRKNIGLAILNKRGDPYLKQWEWDLTSRESKEKYLKLIDSKRQAEIEKEVSDYMRKCFSFIVFRVDSKEARLSLESKIISTVSLCENCKPTQNWLGNYSTKEKIRQSGLWLVNELWKTPLNEGDVKLLETML